MQLFASGSNSDEITNVEHCLTPNLKSSLLADEPPPPSLIEAGRYKHLQLIGMGGMGRVYKAFDPKLQRSVAIKLVTPSHQNEPCQRLLEREAQAMAQFSNPYVVAVHDLGRCEEGVFIVMDFINGVNLRRWLQSKHRLWSEILDIFIQAGQGLAAIHESGFIHRDFKPENVLIDQTGHARITDLGLVHAQSSPTDLNTSGTLRYMSPEQYEGSPLDERSDQFSFCIALHEALHGCLPFALHDRNLRQQQITRGILCIGAEQKIPSRIEAAIRRGLAPHSEERWPTLRVLMQKLSSELLSPPRFSYQPTSNSSPLSARILIVDDERGIRKLCSDILRSQKYNVETVKTGEEALSLTAEQSFDLIFVDVHLPGMDGIEFLSQIRHLHPQQRVVLITGFPSIETAIQGMRKGAYDYLTKPFTPDELRAVATRVLSDLAS